MKILITGINGLIGQILYKALKNKHDIVGIDVSGYGCYGTDISNLLDLDETFINIGHIDCIIHLAADKSDDGAWESILKNNIVGTRNVYECAEIRGIKKIIFASSNHVTGGYGYPPNRPLMPEYSAPDSNYGTSKAFGEAIARQYCYQYGISSICLRIGYVPESNLPFENPKYTSIWLSHRDLVQLFEKSLEFLDKASPCAVTLYGISNNRTNLLSIKETKSHLGYEPQDDASEI